MPPFDLLPLAAESSNLLAARNQMAFTLGFHIVLACLGVALPATILVANYLGLKRGDGDAMELARRWSKAMAVTFAVGAVTGTVLSFEFGLLWPEFMDRWGGVFGVAFAIAGLFALHSEARYVYDRLVDQGLPLVVLSLPSLALLYTLSQRDLLESEH